MKNAMIGGLVSMAITAVVAILFSTLPPQSARANAHTNFQPDLGRFVIVVLRPAANAEFAVLDTISGNVKVCSSKVVTPPDFECSAQKIK